MNLKKCTECHSSSTIGYRIPLDIWRAVVKEGEQHPAFITKNQTMCYKCFIKKADELEVPWKDTIELYPLNNEGKVI